MSSDLHVGKHEASSGPRRSGARQTGTPLVLLVVGVLLAATSQFVLDTLADTTLAWHWIQHGVLFAGGAAVGAAVTLYQLAGRARG